MPKPLSTQRGTSPRTGELIASAVRTLDVEATGISTLAAAIHDGLGRALCVGPNIFDRSDLCALGIDYLVTNQIRL